MKRGPSWKLLHKNEENGEGRKKKRMFILFFKLVEFPKACVLCLAILRINSIYWLDIYLQVLLLFLFFFRGFRGQSN